MQLYLARITATCAQMGSEAELGLLGGMSVGKGLGLGLELVDGGIEEWRREAWGIVEDLMGMVGEEAGGRIMGGEEISDGMDGLEWVRLKGYSNE